jgi:hypothetical protein
VVARQALEFVLPRDLSFNTVAVAPLRRHGGEVWIGVDDDDLPAAQSFSGVSQLAVAPAWRLPRDVASLTPARSWVVGRLEREYGALAGSVWELGGRYHPSAGLTPEVVHPLAIEISDESRGARSLLWLRLREAVRHASELRDGHLLILAVRAAHALGLLAESAQGLDSTLS